MAEEYMFSVIIPYYNAKDTIERALDSLTRQKKYKPKFEVIIVDDNSDEEQKCDDIIKKYQNENFDIRLLTNETGYKGPGPARQTGMDEARSAWVTCLDADDEFEDNILYEVSQTIVKEKLNKVIWCVFHQYRDGQRTRMYNKQNSQPWVHGKYYNKQFLKDNDIRFNLELYSHEDVCFNQQIAILWRQDESTIFHLPTPAYKWNFKEDSFTTKWYDSEEFEGVKQGYREYFLKDYLAAVIGTHLNYCKKHEITKMPLAVIHGFLFGYFYYQGELNRLRNLASSENKKLMKHYLKDICETFQINPYMLIESIYGQFRQVYNEARSAANADFVESQSIRDFILNL